MGSNGPGGRPHPGQPAISRWQGIARMEDRFDRYRDLWSALTDPQRLAHWYGDVEATCAWAVSTAFASMPADRKAQDAWKRASPRSGCS